MSTVPKVRVERVQFYEDHIAPFTTHAVAIGLTSGEVTDLTAKTTAARNAYNAQQAAIQASKAATEAFYNAVVMLSIAGDAAITKIRAKASVTNDANIYTLAQIPAPATPTPAGPPGTPSDFKVTLGSTGTINLSWKNRNATSCVYMIYRKLTATGQFESLGGTGAKKYSDNTVPAGTAQVQYQVQAVRSTGLSEWALVVVNLGNNELGQQTATVTEVTATKLAA
jgi:hypothetical protein